MPTYKPYTKHQLDFALREIGRAIYTTVAPLDIRAWWSKEPLPFAERTHGKELTLRIGDKWGDLFDCAWFHFTGVVPPEAAGQHVVLLLDVNGEMCVFDADGVPVRGLTSMASGYDFSLGEPGKRVLQIAVWAKGGERLDVWADAGCNDLFGNLQNNGTVREAAIAICHDEVRALYYDFEVLLDFLNVLPENSPRYQQILTGLHDVVALLYRGIPAAAVDARAVLAPLLAQRGGDPSLRISAVGHAHMDLGWLWPIRETIRKGARTFSTAIELTERYPDYVFGASQPQYFLWMKQRYPALYAKIKDKVREGRLEPQGAMWVEADTNISGGEALVRQLLQGKRFFRQEFGVEVRYLWLPDVFGYSATLPQLLKLADVDYFSTQKLSWSLINPFPHQSFHWQGLDGTTVLAHMLPEETYNSPAAPRSVRRIEQNYHDSGVSSRALMVFGIGDGGGGPGEEHLERLSRLQNLEGLSPVTQESVADFLDKWREEADRFPTWVGELYLERHEGTLTTEARNKWYNRKMELALRELEWAATLARVETGVAYPTDFLTATWREVLLYQFHDILPGSAIKRVYDESLARYEAMFRETNARIVEFYRRIAARVDTVPLAKPMAVFNPLSWEREEWVPMEGSWLRVAVPPLGYTVIDAAVVPCVVENLTATPEILENDLLRVTFAPDGGIISLFDKRVNREVIPAGQTANRLAVYVDLGDAWDFPMDYADQTPRMMELVSTAAHIDGPRAVLTQIYRLGDSEMTQEIVLTAGSPRLDFVCHLHWREPRAMLRTRFPVAVHADEATYEIQFGHIRRPAHRNTTWDLAKDEVAAHKWVDLSQGDYGVALLNDAKYGHKIKGNVIDLNLLRSVPYPGSTLLHPTDVAPGEPHHAFTDQADHIFTYALYPHTGDAVAGGVIHAGYALNVPLRVVPLESHAGASATQSTFVQIDAPNVIVEAVKQAEDSSDIIVRLYEAEHRSAHATLWFGFPVQAVQEVNLLERPIQPLVVHDDTVTLDFRPFEIKTLAISLQ
ncbi:MAG TPA: glycoside hydrolase family 38 C-terminal domain-containing protein [Anaerolineae bacterium]|nr:glycoside hydrolase family 38 C-terminal domain-containing protein [Anaerolineae bacterium]HQH37098.1 glycoside hydrolase family 38 C-terminal domain-containing protein [Anaerolineae bacterium]